LNTPAPINFLLIMANSLDCCVMREFLLGRFALEGPVVQCTTDLVSGIEECHRRKPQLLMIDPKCGPDAVKQTIDVATQKHATCIVMLDDRVREGVVLDILPHNQISYLTRQMSSYEVVTSLREAILKQKRVFDVALRDRITVRNNTCRLSAPPQEPSLAALTSKERTVLRLLASGLSVAGSAKHLGVTPSTVDNHKTQMMKKLELHKVTQLTSFAIGQGLIQI
jgi:DNA-binding NarL/FixJ family response regulator